MLSTHHICSLTNYSLPNTHETISDSPEAFILITTCIPTVISSDIYLSHPFHVAYTYDESILHPNNHLSCLTAHCTGSFIEKDLELHNHRPQTKNGLDMVHPSIWVDHDVYLHLEKRWRISRTESFAQIKKGVFSDSYRNETPLQYSIQ